MASAQQRQDEIGAYDGSARAQHLKGCRDAFVCIFQNAPKALALKYLGVVYEDTSCAPSENENETSISYPAISLLGGMIKCRMQRCTLRGIIALVESEAHANPDVDCHHIPFRKLRVSKCKAVFHKE